jgi:hypothetical protein
MAGTIKQLNPIQRAHAQFVILHEVLPRIPFMQEWHNGTGYMNGIINGPSSLNTADCATLGGMYLRNEETTPAEVTVAASFITDDGRRGVYLEKEKDGSPLCFDQSSQYFARIRIAIFERYSGEDSYRLVSNSCDELVRALFFNWENEAKKAGVKNPDRMNFCSPVASEITFDGLLEILKLFPIDIDPE